MTLGGNEGSVRRGMTFVLTMPFADMTITEKALLAACLHTDKRCSGLVAQAIEDMRVATADAQWFMDAPLYEVFLVLNAMHEVQPYLVDGERLGRAVRRLLACEVKPGGPYAVRPGSVEYVANACIAVLMRWAAKPLPVLDDYLAGWCDPALLKCAASPLGILLADAFLCSERQLDQKELDRACQGLVHLQRPDGSWPEFNGQGITLSPLAVSLLMVDLLRLPPVRSARQVMQRAAERVTQASYPFLHDVPVPVATRMRQLIDYVDMGDFRLEVRLLPALFAQSLVNPPPIATQKFCRLLGVANVFTWIAYTIYDDFFDDEGDPALLPAAHSSVRLAQYSYLRAMPSVDDYNKIIRGVFDKVDAANAWEMANLRQRVGDGCLRVEKLPEMEDLAYIADRALFHILGPMVILAHMKNIAGPVPVEMVQRAFRNYLIARQLDDDLRDWRKDLRRGQLTPVTVALLKSMQIGDRVVAFDDLLPRAEIVFWRDVLPDMCNLALQYIADSRKELAESGLFRRSHKIGMLQGNIEKSMKDALAAREQGRAFLKTFK